MVIAVSLAFLIFSLRRSNINYSRSAVVIKVAIQTRAVFNVHLCQACTV